MPDESNELSGLSESHRQEALKRFYLIRPHLEEGVAIPKISEGSSFSVRTLRRWVKRYSENGLLGLARTRKSPPEPEVTIETIIEGVYLASPDISISNLKRRVDDIAPDMNLKTVSYSSVYRIVKAIDPRLISLAHDGRKAYSEKFDLVHRRECSKPNEIWQADHTQLDILVYNEKGKVVRPWLTIILDDYSRAICGYSINTESPCALNTALVLHDSIWRKHEPNWHVCGIPDKFYTDHGSDFTSRHMEQVAADLRMQLIFSTKGNPRGRGKLERFFGTVNQLFLSNLPGYISRRCKSEPSISLKTLEEKFKSWLLKEYLVSIHDEIGMAPLGKWQNFDFIPRLPQSLEQLDLLLLTVSSSRLVRPDGIHFQGFRYTSPVLAGFVRETVYIRYNPKDLGQIRAFYEGKYLCTAICTELSGITCSIKDVIQARNHQRRELKKAIESKVSIVAEYLAVHRPKTTLPMVQEEAATEKVVQTRLKKYEC